MGRIEKALRRSREDHLNKRTSPDNEMSAVSIADGIEAANYSIDVSRLPIMVPDDEALEKYRVVAALKDDPQRGAYKVLRTRILQRLRASQFNVIGITGPGPGEGKTLTAINLAYSLAQDVNHQVILADLDLRRPSIHEYLGMSPQERFVESSRWFCKTRRNPCLPQYQPTRGYDMSDRSPGLFRYPVFA